MSRQRLYLDSANVDDIRRFISSSAVAGVTTNPSLMAKEEKGDYLARLFEICKVIWDNKSSEKKHLSVEVTTLVPDEMYGQALFLRERLSVFDEHIDVHVKIPILVGTLSTITDLVERGVNVNATAAFNVLQAKLAEDAGAHVVSFFWNRMLDNGVDATQQVRSFNSMRTTASVICGSIRRADDVYKCWTAGADVVTASAKVIEEMAHDPGTAASVARFQKDIDAWLA